MWCQSVGKHIIKPAEEKRKSLFCITIFLKQNCTICPSSVPQTYQMILSSVRDLSSGRHRTYRESLVTAFFFFFSFFFFFCWTITFEWRGQGGGKRERNSKRWLTSFINALEYHQKQEGQNIIWLSFSILHGFKSLLIYLGTGATPKAAGVGTQRYGRRDIRFWPPCPTPRLRSRSFLVGPFISGIIREVRKLTPVTQFVTLGT